MTQWPRIIWYVLTLQCDEAERCRCAPDPDDLRRHQVIAERLHRIICKSCRQAKRKLEIVDRAMSRLGTGAELEMGTGLSADSRRRITDALEHAAEE